MKTAHTSHCEKCTKRIPVNHPKLYCSLCNKTKHFKCERLTKTDALNIIASQNNWICGDCIIDILPINATTEIKHSCTKPPQTKVQCSACEGMSYSPLSVTTCTWCERAVHKKCSKNLLGCIKCCEDMIPGYGATNYELMGNYDRLNNLLYNPYDQSHLTNLIGDMLDDTEQSNDSWNEISDLLIKCKYKQFKNIQVSTKHELKILSLNIQSLNKNITCIRDEIESFQKCDFLCFSETNCIVEKLPNGINDLLLDGFHEPIVQTPIRRSGRGGGLAIYVNKNVCEHDNIMTFNPNPDPANGSGEFQFIKIQQCKGANKTVTIGNIYRSPSKNSDTFNRLFESVVNSLSTRHACKHTYLAGDFNIDLIKHDSNIQCQNLINNMTNLGFIQLVSRPTRITDHSATLIDHVYTNNIHSTISCNILTIDISDHLATLTTISIDNSNTSNFRQNRTDIEGASYRIFNEASDEIFKNLIYNEDWNNIYNNDLDAESHYDLFLNTYSKHYDSAYPPKKGRARRKHERENPKPWILPWLEDACARKNDLYHAFVKNRTTSNERAYKKMKKFVEKHLKLAKDKYHRKYFDQYKDNSKKQWHIINTLLNRKSNRADPIKLHDDNGTLLKSSSEVAEKFNNYFTNIAANLKSKISARSAQDPTGFREFLNNPSQHSIYLRPVEPGEVHNIIMNFKNKATLDTKMNVLKIANSSFHFTHALARVINKSFEQGVFPQSLKLARVVPIHKGNSKTEVSNYRPISLLSSFSKIYEKLMHNRVLEFLDSNGSLFEMQYGFRPGRSCEHALLNAQNLLLSTMSKKQISLLLLIDFSKAFDMVEHSILLQKLQHYGIRGIALQWFKSYLQNRKQFVSVDGTNSSCMNLNHGVPQGSILGPLLFIIYINDLPGISCFAKFILYADDANIIITGYNMHEISTKLNSLAQGLLRWVDCNGLALNLKKTSYIIFSKQRINLSEDLHISGTKIERKSEARFLGVIVDEKLSWTRHISTVKAKMARYIGIMHKIKNQLPQQARIQIFHSFVQSHLNYCSLVWGFASKSNIESLFSTQKSAIRAIMPGFVNFYYHDGTLPSHTKSFFEKYDILTVHGIILKNSLLFMHKIHHFPTALPSSICATIPSSAPTFTSNHDNSADWLENYNNIHFRSSIFFKGPLLVLSLHNEDTPTTVTCNTPIKPYKAMIKLTLLVLQNTGADDEWPQFLLYRIQGLRKSDRLRQ